MGKTFSTGLLTDGIAQDSSNNIGIGGAVNASYKLTVTGTTLTTGAATFSSSVTAGGNVIAPQFYANFGGAGFRGIEYQNSGTIFGYSKADAGSGEYRHYIGPSSGWGGYMTFYTDNSERMRITSGGTIALGNAGNGTGYGVEFNNNATQPRLDFVVNGTYTAQLRGSGTDAFLQNNGSGGNIIFQTNGGSGATERMRITSGGNVLIGTTTDSSPWRMSIANGSACNLYISHNSGYGMSIESSANSSVYLLMLRASSGATDRFSFLSNGIANFYAYANGTLSISSGQVVSSSDKNLKTDDGGIDNALNKVLQLNPRYFYWKEDSGIKTTERQLGFYAQDVKNALGEEVANDKSNGKWGIYDRGIIAMLTKAVQELSAKVTALENK